MTTLGHYGLATLLVVVETAVFYTLGRLLGVERAPFLLFTPSVLIAAFVGGRNAGLYATTLGVVAAELVLLEPRPDHLSAFVAIRLGLFVASGVGISVMAGHLQAARARAEEREAGAERHTREAERRAADQRFLADASRLLTGSLDYEATLGQLSALAVPAMADWTMLEVVDADGRVTRLSTLPRDETAPLPAERLGRAADDDPATFRLATIVTPLRLADVSDEAMRGLDISARQRESLRRRGVASLVVMPLRLHGARLGAFAWLRGRGRPPFDDRDLLLADEVACRAAMAVDHARLYRDVQAASRLKDEFVATLSHELRTPLNALLGWIDLARSGQLPPDRQQEAIEAIHRTALSQVRLTNDLVDVSRVVSGTFRLKPALVDLGPLVRDTTETFRLAAESKGLTLDCVVDASLPPVVADVDRVRQIVYNLVGNAVKFTADGSVTVTAQADGDAVALVVCDTGIGIRSSFLPFVFDRFRQADGSVAREFGGLGLGLSIVRALVELHGGTVAVESGGEGLGATFTVRLPAAAPVRPPAGAAAVGSP